MSTGKTDRQSGCFESGFTPTLIITAFTIPVLISEVCILSRKLQEIASFTLLQDYRENKLVSNHHSVDFLELHKFKYIREVQVA